MIVSIMTFNIDNVSCNRPEQFCWENRKDNTVKMLKETEPMIIAMQEVCSENIKTITSNFPQYNIYTGHETENDSGLLLSNPILWDRNFKMLKSGCFYLSKNIEHGVITWDEKEIRKSTWVILSDKKELFKLLVVNTHLDHKGVRARREASFILMNFIRDMSEKECCNALLLGDFNTRAWYPYDEDPTSYGDMIYPECLPKDDIMSLYRNAGFKDAYLMAGNSDCLQSNTYNDYQGDKFPSVGLRLDWQLVWGYDDNFMIQSYCTYKKYIVSDHYPVLCTYIMK